MPKKVTAKKVEKKIVPILEAMKEQLDEVMKDAVKFDNGTNAAGTRVRNAMQVFKKEFIQEVRDTVTEVRNIRKG